MNDMFGQMSGFGMSAGMRQRHQILKANGRQGALGLAGQMYPDSNALALDTADNIMWLIQTDSSGYPSVQAFDIAPHVEPEPVDVNLLMQRIARLEEVVNGKYSAGCAGPEASPDSGKSAG